MRGLNFYSNKSFMQQILCVLFFVFNIYLTLSLQAQNLTYKNLPKNLFKNLAVTLSYWQQINDFFGYNEKPPSDCKIKSTINSRVLICPAWVKTLINKKQLLSWKQEQKKNGFINLYLPKIGIMHEKVKIAKVKKIKEQAPTNKNQYLVTVVYMRYAHVFKYKIKDIDTGKTVEITATPEHKFYETTYKKFMAISKLGSNNTLINSQNHYLKIICTNNRQNNCGTAPLNSLQKVYNMEVEKAHNYFVGNIKVLVHNGCYDYYYKCVDCDEAHAEKNLFSSECKKTANKAHNFLKLYTCEFCGLSYRDESKLEFHEAIHYDIIVKFTCPHCLRKFTILSEYGNHIPIHFINTKESFCRKCDMYVPLIDGKIDERHRHLDQSKTLLNPSRTL